MEKRGPTNKIILKHYIEDLQKILCLKYLFSWYEFNNNDEKIMKKMLIKLNLLKKIEK